MLSPRPAARCRHLQVFRGLALNLGLSSLWDEKSWQQGHLRPAASKKKKKNDTRVSHPSQVRAAEHLKTPLQLTAVYSLPEEPWLKGSLLRDKQGSGQECC